MSDRSKPRQLTTQSSMPSLQPGKSVRWLRREATVRLWLAQVIDEFPVEAPLREVLRNGVFLCELIKAIRPTLIPKIVPDPSLPFKMKQNIAFFLQACEDIGVPRFLQFDPSDLLDDNGNIFRVVECIEAVAWAAQKEGWQGPAMPAEGGTKKARASVTENLWKNREGLRALGADKSLMRTGPSQSPQIQRLSAGAGVVRQLSKDFEQNMRQRGRRTPGRKRKASLPHREERVGSAPEPQRRSDEQPEQEQKQENSTNELVVRDVPVIVTTAAEEEAAEEEDVAEQATVVLPVTVEKGGDESDDKSDQDESEDEKSQDEESEIEDQETSPTAVDDEQKDEQVATDEAEEEKSEEKQPEEEPKDEESTPETVDEEPEASPRKEASPVASSGEEPSSPTVASPPTPESHSIEDESKVAVVVVVSENEQEESKSKSESESESERTADETTPPAPLVEQTQTQTESDTEREMDVKSEEEEEEEEEEESGGEEEEEEEEGESVKVEPEEDGVDEPTSQPESSSPTTPTTPTSPVKQKPSESDKEEGEGEGESVPPVSVPAVSVPVSDKREGRESDDDDESPKEVRTLDGDEESEEEKIAEKNDENDEELPVERRVLMSDDEEEMEESVVEELVEVHIPEVQEVVVEEVVIKEEPSAPKSVTSEPPSSPLSTASSEDDELRNVTFTRTERDRIIHAVTVLQACVRRRFAARVYQKLLRNVAYRDNVANEILRTETVYISSLTTIKDVFLDPLRDALKLGEKQQIIPAAQIKKIFADVEVILNYSRQLYSQLKPRVESWSPQQCLGDIFLKIVAFLKVYTQYVKNHNKALRTINKCKQRYPAFVNFLRRCEGDERTKRQQLNGFLITPVQRIPRYELLLADLCKHTDPAHPDFANLKEAYTKMKDVAEYVNEKKIEAENIWRVLEVQNKIAGKYDNLALPHRRFVKEGPLIVLPRKKERMVFLFNDLFVITRRNRGTIFNKAKGEAFAFEEAVLLTDCTFDFGRGSNTIDILESNGALKMTLHTLSTESKDEWRVAFKKITREIARQRTLTDALEQTRRGTSDSRLDAIREMASPRSRSSSDADLRSSSESSLRS